MPKRVSRPRNDRHCGMMSRSSAPQPRSALKLAALVILSAASSLSGDSLNGQTAKAHHPLGMFDQVLAMHHAVVRADLRALCSPVAWFAEHGLVRSESSAQYGSGSSENGDDAGRRT